MPVINDARQVAERLRLGTFQPSDEAPRGGRNENITGTTSRGHEVFVKKLKGEHSAHRLRKLISFEETCRPHLPSTVRTPECFGWEAAPSVVVFHWLKAAKSGHTLASSDSFTEDLARRCGKLLGAVHATAPDLLAPAPRPNQPNFFKALPLSYYEQASGAELEVWRVLHRDGHVAASLNSLRKESAQVEHTLIHADLRLDQFLFDSEGPLLCDWEEWDVGDPARDVGAFAGEWLHRAVLGMATDGPAESERALPAAGQASSPHTRVLDRGLSRLATAHDKVAAFWAGYTATLESPAVDVAERASGYAGWHLLERVLSGAQRLPQLSTLDRMMLGIGSTALASPRKFVGVIGLGSGS
ncbi:class V lanthionine synthetase subunit LxmK [Streptomyces sp. NBC_00847]|uniref:class V lanthionine synthetase subunit LxmK n=1 Tax=Streptomyces sp. NBC_00847 TaxID=2975850 RepID=UPI00224D2A00|nr:class V lanthionine synthetase subunit LxmK [Streptomyces sp. NBC_00847]MCX4880357.1 class V lanthionine synthetase subunit LxmK [Streptomyces sp. NBC_00847]